LKELSIAATSLIKEAIGDTIQLHKYLFSWDSVQVIVLSIPVHVFVNYCFDERLLVFFFDDLKKKKHSSDSIDIIHFFQMRNICVIFCPLSV